MTSEESEPLPHRDRMHRVVLLCCAIARNGPFYRTGCPGPGSACYFFPDGKVR